MTVQADGVETPPPYPARLEITRPEQQRRLTNFPLLVGDIIRLVLLAPHLLLLLILYFAQIAAFFLSTFAIVFTGRYPRGLFKLQVGVIRWQTNVTAYLLHLTDEYPPMDLEERTDPHLRIEIDYPEHPSRWLNSPFLGFLAKFILLVPHQLIVSALSSLASVLVFIALFAILFTRSFPAGLYALVVVYLRYQLRVTAYQYAFTDRYPPFSFS